MPVTETSDLTGIPPDRRKAQGATSSLNDPTLCSSIAGAITSVRRLAHRVRRHRWRSALRHEGATARGEVRRAASAFRVRFTSMCRTGSILFSRSLSNSSSESRNRWLHDEVIE